MTEPAPSPPGGIVARVDFQYRWRTWALCILFLGFALWSLRDGFVKYPQENAAWARLDPRVNRPPKPPHEESSVAFNQIAGVLLVLLVIPFTAWRAYRSRGRYVLEGNTLSVPGHPPLKLDDIRNLDLVQWDRRGIAAIEYGAPGQAGRKLYLNDMIYERSATDRIVERVEKHLEAQDAAAGAEPT